MATAQGSPRGLLYKNGIKLVNSTGSVQMTPNASGLVLDGGIRISDKAGGQVSANTTALILPGQVRLGATKHIGGNSTGYLFTAVAAKPSTRTAGYNWTMITNSTGVSGIAIRTTGTTWKFVNLTSVLPT